MGYSLARFSVAGALRRAGLSEGIGSLALVLWIIAGRTVPFRLFGSNGLKFEDAMHFLITLYTNDLIVITPTACKLSHYTFYEATPCIHVFKPAFTQSCDNPAPALNLFWQMKYRFG